MPGGFTPVSRPNANSVRDVELGRLSYTPSSTLAVSLADMKRHVRITGANDDSLLTDYILSATRLIEQRTNRIMINTTITGTWDALPLDGDCIILPKSPLSSVTSIVYTDTDGASQTWSSANYVVDTNVEPGRVRLAYQQDWPTLRSSPNALVVTYVVGYGSSESDVDTHVKHAIRMTVGHWFENRESVVTGTISTELPEGITHLLTSFEVPEVV